MDTADLKEESPHLVVGDEPEVVVQTNAAVIATAEKDKTEMAPLSKLEDANADAVPFASPAEPAPFVLSVVDVVVLCFVLLSFVLVALTPGGGTSDSEQFFAMESLVFIAVNGLFQTYYLSDVVSRIHKARGDTGFWPWLDKLACFHPSLLGIVLAIPVGFLVAIGSGSSSDFSGPLFALFLTWVVFTPVALRWFYLTGSLFYKCSQFDKGPAKKFRKGVMTLGGLATICSLYVLTALWAMPGPFALALNSLIMAVCFIALRNVIIQSNPTLQFGPMAVRRARVPSEGDVQIRYNHFVEIQKWFKQRFALRSPWKVGLALLILIAAVAGHLHVAILDWITNNIVALSGVSVKDADHIIALHTGITDFNSLSNSLLVMAFGWITFALASGSLLAFARAPKKLAASKDGLHLIFARVSGKPEQTVSWQSIKHIKVERPHGKTSAASDRLVFEQFSGHPLTLKLAGISSADDREKLLGAIDRFAPQIDREAAIEETLRRPADQNYTELWLQALAAPPKREKLKPLVKDASLSDNRYLVRGELGVGGQGFAYLALDQRKDKEVVLKEFVLPVFVDINARRQSLESFEKEAKLMTRLDHSQVVKLEGFFVEDHRAYLVLEHIDGQNLRQIIERDGPMSEARIKELASQMCSILSYLHGLSPPLVHRDFTPDNLILHRDGTLKLIDFNVAQQVEYATTGTVVGKQAYLPPEQFRGQAVPASDLYAFGATLYFLAGGKDPTPISVARPIKDGLSVSPLLDHLISSLTQMEPQARPDNAEVVADLLRPRPKEITKEETIS